MHPSTALACVIVDELVRGGVREAVLAPGSRSAPLAYALEAADRAGRLRLHVRVDERSAAFLALGMARASGRPVPVVTTSGTAVANLHPAVLEAHHSGIPLVVVSADRPAELRGTGANQTTAQPGIFAGALRWEADLPAPASVPPGAAGEWRSTVCRALAAAVGAPPGWAGPVHLNVSFRDPLVPDLADVVGSEGSGVPEGRAGGGPWTLVDRVPAAPAEPVEPGERTVVLLGDLPTPDLAHRATAWAAAAGWPVLAEPFGALPVGESVVPHGVLVAGRVARGAEGLQHLVPERVVVVGRLTLFRELGALSRLPGVRVEQVSAVPAWTDPGHVVERVRPLGALEQPVEPTVGADGWVSAWLEAGRAMTPAVVEAVGLGDGRMTGVGDGQAGEATPTVTGPGVAITVAASLQADDVLVLGSSNGPRDLALVLGAVPVPACRVVANRGLAGIDGTVSTAVGVALAHEAGRAVALMGDLTFLHDANGLLIGPDEPRPDLTIVVVNDDGGGIFSTLEYGEPQRNATPLSAAATERVFGTPHGTDLGALCAAHHVGHTRVTTLAGLRDTLARPTEGLRVVEVPLDRTAHRPLRDRLR
ncbi:2-succinyl-5-enolpyruvyl-6-hydroxy-3-cyclohexene-1-carboxylic-acid synthase [Ornithinimicrobium tianjinense]|uniref:2-succinyl-5-enolpyruvyl-6-hydroxy-3-cyclohexene-1-carboxylate synthase n=1 Tax=Ornithinimicrobium tianjinense TaxID=1195761 RepID=A0A917BRB3_9MICO|nr:2-succinyl-5-enolpyruvyl-6-hydroxy-3-cyclohexene-1-carboxylic-acid synthase [Ornithinimicrobium tianjinense]GGF55803.1 2-succinyl-5-enolpyruvyl-6-hydroxy-3-cyclohexene-1-carboxylate synthase [Ornithinimicrobium tianjinense]